MFLAENTHIRGISKADAEEIPKGLRFLWGPELSGIGSLCNIPVRTANFTGHARFLAMGVGPSLHLGALCGGSLFYPSQTGYVRGTWGSHTLFVCIRLH